MQKVAYLLELAGLGDGFQFEYRHYGPYSEDLADAIRVANAFSLVSEEEHRADWGGVYSIYNATDKLGERSQGIRATFAQAASQIEAVELELAATAAYLCVVEKCSDPWKETKRRKPEKASRVHLEEAKRAYRELQKLTVPRPLPKIA